MGSAKISIVIPVYNVEQYIVRCLQSVVSQKNIQDIEVILVDDCGTDNSLALAKEFLADYPCVDCRILHHTKNGGLSAARNTGLRAAKGDYVYFLDSDDEITSDCMVALTAPLKDKNYEFVIGGYNVKGSKLDYPLLSLKEGEVVGNDSIMTLYSTGKWYMMAWNKLCNREFLLKNNLLFEDGLLHEDVVWSFKLACKASSMYVIEQHTYNYYIRGESIMTAMSLEKDVEIYKRVFLCISEFVASEYRIEDPNVYSLFYGRLSSFLFSLLSLKRKDLYDDVYTFCDKTIYLSPLRAYFKGVVGLKYLIRDIHYAMPVTVGKLYKWLFYQLAYGIRKKRIEGSFWRV